MTEDESAEEHATGEVFAAAGGPANLRRPSGLSSFSVVWLIWEALV